MAMGRLRSRQRRIPTPGPSTTPVDLFLIAGLPNPLHASAERFVQNLAGPSAKVASPSASSDGLIYRKNTVQILLSAGAHFAVRRLKNRSDDQTARPRRIALLYVPAEDQEKLIDAFDFFVFPIPLRDLAQYDSAGRQRRHDGVACEQAIKEALGVYKAELVGLLQRKIESRRSHEPLLLPPVNFHLPNDRLRRTFRELTRGVRAWEKAMPDTVAAESFDRDSLPDFLRPQEHQLIFKDDRGVVFPCSRAIEMHGARAAIDPAADVELLRDTLRSTYRFGVSLPQGFHHDAQFDFGRHFDRTPFDCCQKGTLLVSGSHANIYPNDFVNPAQQHANKMPQRYEVATAAHIMNSSGCV